jgi:hypothetical protein
VRDEESPQTHSTVTWPFLASNRTLLLRFEKIPKSILSLYCSVFCSLILCRSPCRCNNEIRNSPYIIIWSDQVNCAFSLRYALRDAWRRWRRLMSGAAGRTRSGSTWGAQRLRHCSRGSHCGTCCMTVILSINGHCTLLGALASRRLTARNQHNSLA